VALHRLPAVAVLSGVLILATQAPTIASAAMPRTLVIGVDHADPANQQPGQGRVFEYTDFFSRNIRIRQGDTLDFRTAPGAVHVVALARDEHAARTTYPVALLDSDDPNAIGSGRPKIELGPSNGPITDGNEKTGGGQVGGPSDPPFCGLSTSASVCTFFGGDDVEAEGSVVPTFDPQGNPVAADWKVTVLAGPGTYSYFCFIHPGMRGSFTVVQGDHDRDRDDAITTQAEINAASAAEFSQDQSEGLAAERSANEVHFTGGAPGTRTYDVSVGVGTPDLKVAVDEMLPQHLNLAQGDRVAYHWPDRHNVHTVGFPATPPNVTSPLPGPFVPDAETDNEPFELIGDPGTAPPGTLLSNPNAVVDSGLRIGIAYGLEPTSQRWSVRTNASSSTGTYAYQCTVHDFMVGTLTLSP